MDIVQTMNVRRLRAELKRLNSQFPKLAWMQERIKDLEAELRVRASFFR